MAKPSSYTIISLLPALAVLLVATVPAADATVLPIIKACERAVQEESQIDLNCCINSFKAVPESFTAGLEGFLGICNHLALENATHTIGIIEKLQSVACQPILKVQLGLCHTVYVGISTALKLSSSFGAAGDFLKIGKTLAVSAGLNLCEGVLNQSGHEGLLSVEIGHLRQLVLMTKVFGHFCLEKGVSIGVGHGRGSSSSSNSSSSGRGHGSSYSSPPPIIPRV